MPVLSNIPFSLDASEMMPPLRIEPGSDDAAEFAELVGVAKKVGNPKAIYKEAFIEDIADETARIGGVVFNSRTLSNNLKSAERVFAYVSTCGCEIHEAFPAKGDILKEYWWDTIKARLLAAAGKHLSEHLHARFRLGKTATMSPGSGDAMIWPIEQQKPLFSLIGDVGPSIGVELTDSFLMVPNKTVSGILFPTEKDFRTCQVCHREGCPSRSAPFDEEIWRTTQCET